MMCDCLCIPQANIRANSPNFLMLEQHLAKVVRVSLLHHFSDGGGSMDGGIFLSCVVESWESAH